jgi:hypothetical protein
VLELYDLCDIDHSEMIVALTRYEIYENGA